MNDKGFGLLLLLAILVYVIIKIAIIAAILVAIGAVVYFIYKAVKYSIQIHKARKNRKIRYKQFYDYLKNNYTTQFYMVHKDKIELPLSKTIVDIFFSKNIEQDVIDRFNILTSEFVNAFKLSSVYVSDVADSQMTNKWKVKIGTEKFLQINQFCNIPEFTLTFNKANLHLMPNVCFYEDDNSLSIINWNNIFIFFKKHESEQIIYGLDIVGKNGFNLIFDKRKVGEHCIDQFNDYKTQILINPIYVT